MLCAGWVQCQLGRCWYEKVDYPQARLAFESARRREAHRLEVCTPCWPASICNIRGQNKDAISQHCRLAPLMLCQQHAAASVASWHSMPPLPAPLLMLQLVSND